MAAHGTEAKELRDRVLAWLWLYRAHSGIATDKQFCAQLGISKSSLNDYRHRGRTPGVDLLEALRRTFGADINDVIDRRPTPADEAELRRVLAALAASRDTSPARGRRRAVSGG